MIQTPLSHLLTLEFHAMNKSVEAHVNELFSWCIGLPYGHVKMSSTMSTGYWIYTFLDRLTDK